MAVKKQKITVTIEAEFEVGEYCTAKEAQECVEEAIGTLTGTGAVTSCVMTIPEHTIDLKKAWSI